MKGIDLHRSFSSQASFIVKKLALLLCCGLPMLTLAQHLSLEKRIQKAESWQAQAQWDSLEALSLDLMAWSGKDKNQKAHAESRAHLLRNQIPTYRSLYRSCSQDLHALDSLVGIESGINKSKNLLHIYFHLGHVNFCLKSYPLAEKHFQQALLMNQHEKDSHLQMEIFQGLALTANYLETKYSSLDYYKKALAIAKEKAYSEEIEKSLNQVSTIYFAMGRWDSARLYFEELLDIKRTRGDSLELISDLTQLGHMLSSQGKFGLGQQYHFQALELAGLRKDTFLMCGILTDLTKSYYNQENWEKTIEYGRRVLDLLAPYRLRGLEASNYRLLGLAYQKLGRDKEALQAFRQAQASYRSMSSPPAEALQVEIHIAEVLEKEANYEEALQLLLEALKQRQKYSVGPDMLELHIVISDIYLKIKQPKKALFHLQKAEGLSKKLDSKRSLEQSFGLMAESYAQLGNFRRGYSLKIQQGELRDSLFNQERSRVVQELETKYQAAQKDRRNAELAVEIANKQLELEKNNSIILKKTQQNYVLIGSLAFLLALMAFLFFLYHNRQRLLEQRMMTLQKEAEAQNLRAVLQGEEQERQRVARDLHDGLGALLASVKVLFQTLEVEFPFTLNSKHYQKADRLLDHACKEVRSISHNMVSSTLQEYGLEQAIHSLCQLTRNHHNLEINEVLFGLDDSIGEEVQISVYRIVQELLRNIVKHAKAREVLLQVSAEDGLLILTMEDDGIGFSTHKTESHGIGLNNIRSRVQYLSGKIDIDSSPGAGSTINIEIPLKVEPSKT